MTEDLVAPGAKEMKVGKAPAQRSARRRIVLRFAALGVAGVGLYVVWPSLLELFSAWPGLRTVDPWLLLLMVPCEAASFVCTWWLLRIVLSQHGWFDIATSQVAGNAFSRIVPGGAAAGGALQFQMLVQRGLSPAATASGLTAASLLSTGTVLALPILSLPAFLAGLPVPRGLQHAAWLGAGIFVVLAGVGAVLLFTERPLAWVGRAGQRVANAIHRHRRPRTDLPERLVAERNQVRSVLGSRWHVALVASVGRSLLDFAALLAAVAAVGARPRASLVLLAYAISAVLGMIPITPGGLGFVEAGLTATLDVAGLSGPQALLATLAYRLVSYWLPLLAGVVAYWLHRRRVQHAAPPGRAVTGGSYTGGTTQ